MKQNKNVKCWQWYEAAGSLIYCCGTVNLSIILKNCLGVSNEAEYIHTQ